MDSVTRFQTFFGQKNLHVNRLKRVGENFRFREDIREKHVSALSLSRNAIHFLSFEEEKNCDKSNQKINFIRFRKWGMSVQSTTTRTLQIHSPVLHTKCIDPIVLEPKNCYLYEFCAYSCLLIFLAHYLKFNIPFNVHITSRKHCWDFLPLYSSKNQK